jgi:hypothetical protein
VNRNLSQRAIGWTVAGLVFLATLLPSLAQETDARLREAWNEYSFQSFDAAERLFREAERTASAEDARQQAQIGLAMIRQFDSKRRDLPAAARIYANLLADGLDGEPAALVRSLLAECRVAQGQGGREAVNRLWDQAIADLPSSIVAQDALLRRTFAAMEAWDSPATTNAVEELDRRRAQFPPPSREIPGLAPVMDTLLGNYRFWQGDAERSREAFIRYCDIATTRTSSYGWYSGALFRVAQLSERRLNDRETAGRYYRKIVLETPNCVQSFYCLIKAAELGALSAEEARKLRLHGITDDVVRGIFENAATNRADRSATAAEAMAAKEVPPPNGQETPAPQAKPAAGGVLQ